MGCASGAVKQEVDVPITAIFDSSSMMCFGMHEIGAGECGHSAGVINVRMRVTAHRSTSIILGYCSVSFGRVAHLSVRLAPPPTLPNVLTHCMGDIFVLVLIFLVKSVSYSSFICYLYINVVSMWFNKHAVKLHMRCCFILLNVLFILDNFNICNCILHWGVRET